MRSKLEVSRRGNLVRSPFWHGVREGDAVVVNGAKERRLSWVFVAHVLNDVFGEQWVEVRGGRSGEAKSRSFRTEMIYPGDARRGSRVTGLSLEQAPRLPIY